ncbi:MAG: 6-phosphogluconolactonase [Ardenticatenales bacterium]|nr:6-phosphogluconolactonase [Ardenticatenales bacterium]
MSQKIFCFETTEAWVEGSVEQIVVRLRAAQAARRQATLLLSGGSTPTPIYQALAKVGQVDWKNVQFFWGDERCVPPDHPESNFRLVLETLLEPLGIASDDPHVHRFPTEGAPRDNAAMYEQNMRLFFSLPPGGVPRFDVVLLGMGVDGHTASLFPESEALDEQRHLAVANPVPTLETMRLTVTFPVFSAAHSVLILVKGSEKSVRLAEILTGSGKSYPIQQVTPTQGDLLWLLDPSASSELPKGLCEG